MWKYVKRYLLAVITGVFMMGEVLMDWVQPGIMSRIVDDGVLGINKDGIGDLSLIWTLGLQMIGQVLFGGLCGSMNNVFVHLSGQNIGNEMHKDVSGALRISPFPRWTSSARGRWSRGWQTTLPRCRTLSPSLSGAWSAACF
ncbi:hypothetical protein [Acutalibacter intestini]|uniref:hypothetical protein n=1 Tax=Acutalibacter intestini TaxID=3093659 RepID=UPI002AC9C1CF|nr:hypothetical protein [Acutalibacter sp. M00204]